MQVCVTNTAIFAMSLFSCSTSFSFSKVGCTESDLPKVTKTCPNFPCSMKLFWQNPPTPDRETQVTSDFPLYTHQQHDAIQEKRQYLRSCLDPLAQEKGVFLSDQETATNSMGVVGLISQDLCFLCFNKLGSPRITELKGMRDLPLQTSCGPAGRYN